MRLFFLFILIILTALGLCMNIIDASETKVWNHLIWIPIIMVVCYVGWVDYDEMKKEEKALKDNKERWKEIAKKIDFDWIEKNGLISTREVNGVPIASVSYDAWKWLIERIDKNE